MYADINNVVLPGEKKAVPTGEMALMYIEKGAVFKYINHVHPNNDVSPSGSGNKKGDIGTIKALEKKGIRFSTPEWDRYHIFTPGDKQYHAYDYYTTDTITPVVFSIKRD